MYLCNIYFCFVFIITYLIEIFYVLYVYL
uniref:Uncharacterized protein n=1 Tax=Lepeophtheirus salmonis TaxID=72036 RepID=A0A0K2T8T2_LEPSM